MTLVDEEKLHFLSIQFVMNGHRSKLKHYISVNISCFGFGLRMCYHSLGFFCGILSV